LAVLLGVVSLLFGGSEARAVEEESCAPALENGVLSYGQVVSCDIRPGGDADTLQLFSNAGERLLIRLVTLVSNNVCLQVIDQGTGDVIAQPDCGFNIEIPLDISKSSTYLFRVTREGGFAGTYTLSVDCVTGSCGPLESADFPDADGDGNGDIVVRRGNLFLADSAKDGGAPEVQIRYGAPTDTAFFADMDGDGADELVIRRGNAYLIDLANDGGQPELVLRYGTATDHVLAYDIDNDGRDDLVIRRGNVLLGDTAHDGRFPEKVIRVFAPEDTYLSRSGR